MTVLKKITDIIQNDGDLEEIDKMITKSPAGDGYGCDNYFIDFGFDSEIERFQSMDISDVCHWLKELKK